MAALTTGAILIRMHCRIGIGLGSLKPMAVKSGFWNSTSRPENSGALRPNGGTTSMKRKKPKTRNPIANFLKTQGLRHKVEANKKAYKRLKNVVKGSIDKEID